MTEIFRGNDFFIALSRTISYILRHDPQKFGLQPDDGGFVRVADLLSVLHAHFPEFLNVSFEDFQQMIRRSEKKRHEISGDKIRACYGHSRVNILKPAAVPPDILFHGTTAEASEKISLSGLLPMQRQYVHLSEDRKTAQMVAERRTASAVILQINAKKAFESGIKFYKGNDTTWMSEPIPVAFITFSAEQ